MILENTATLPFSYGGDVESQRCFVKDNRSLRRERYKLGQVGVIEFLIN